MESMNQTPLNTDAWILWNTIGWDQDKGQVEGKPYVLRKDSFGGAIDI